MATHEQGHVLSVLHLPLTLHTHKTTHKQDNCTSKTTASTSKKTTHKQDNCKQRACHMRTYKTTARTGCATQAPTTYAPTCDVPHMRLQDHAHKNATPSCVRARCAIVCACAIPCLCAGTMVCLCAYVHHGTPLCVHARTRRSSGRAGRTLPGTLRKRERFRFRLSLRVSCLPPT